MTGKSPTYVPIPAREAGFTLMEVLVAFLILSVGLLGLAGLQMKGLAYAHQSYQRSLATLLAQDMADRMRANRPAVLLGDYHLTSPPSDPSFTCSGVNSCTPAKLAALDLYQWYHQEIAADLPNGKGVVCVDSDPSDSTPCDGSGNIYSIIVSWSEKAPTGTTVIRKFVTRFQP